MTYTIEEKEQILKTVVVKVNEEYTLAPEIMEFLSKIRIHIYGETEFDRPVDLHNQYVRVMYAEIATDLSMVLIGIEDRDQPQKPDGWTDVLLPVFYGAAPNQGGVEYPIIFVDGAMSGGYRKEFWLRTKTGEPMLFDYSVPEGMRWFGQGPRISVAYIEYDPVKDEVYNPKAI